MPKGTAIFGTEFKRVREELFLTQAEIAARLEMSVSGVQRIEGRYIVSIMPGTLRRMAELVNASPDGLASRLVVPEEKLREIEAGDRISRDELAPDVEDALDGESVSEPVPLGDSIPKFELSVPGGPPSDVSQLDGVDDPLTRKLGLFRIGIAGDSMAPKYPHGTDVIIRAALLRQLKPGQECYLQFSDGTATFKRIVKADKDMISVDAINPKHQPRKLVFPRPQIVYFGRACGIWTDVEDCD